MSDSFYCEFLEMHILKDFCKSCLGRKKCGRHMPADTPERNITATEKAQPELKAGGTAKEIYCEHCGRLIEPGSEINRLGDMPFCSRACVMEVMGK